MQNHFKYLILLSLSLSVVTGCKSEKSGETASAMADQQIQLQKTQAQVEAQAIIQETVDEINQNANYAISQSEIDELLQDGALTEEEYQQLLNAL